MFWSISSWVASPVAINTSKLPLENRGKWMRCVSIVLKLMLYSTVHSIIILGRNGIYFTWVAASYRGEARGLSINASPRVRSLVKFHLSEFRIWKVFSPWGNRGSVACHLLRTKTSATYIHLVDNKIIKEESVWTSLYTYYSWHNCFYRWLINCFAQSHFANVSSRDREGHLYFHLEDILSKNIICPYQLLFIDANALNIYEHM